MPLLAGKFNRKAEQSPPGGHEPPPPTPLDRRTSAQNQQKQGNRIVQLAHVAMQHDEHASRQRTWTMGVNGMGPSDCATCDPRPTTRSK